MIEIDNVIILQTIEFKLIFAIGWMWGYARVKYLNCRCSSPIEKLKEDVQTCFDSIDREQIKKICNLNILRKDLFTYLGDYRCLRLIN